ncbi:hypothetical protein [Clostridium sp.]|uniref:hypothetical protein n=1 Tax=Clostridium sp. TaxID=1506 RepID=UPI0025847D48|nr:hypothetical protein [Clostridium sp.]
MAVTMQETSIKFLENPQKGIQKTGVSSITILRLRHPEQFSFYGRIVHRGWQNTGNEKSWVPPSRPEENFSTLRGMLAVKIW